MKTCRRKGHPLTADTSYINCHGVLICRECRREHQRERYERELRALTPQQHRVIPAREAR